MTIQIKIRDIGEAKAVNAVHVYSETLHALAQHLAQQVDEAKILPLQLLTYTTSFGVKVSVSVES